MYKNIDAAIDLVVSALFDHGRKYYPINVPRSRLLFADVFLKDAYSDWIEARKKATLGDVASKFISPQKLFKIFYMLLLGCYVDSSPNDQKKKFTENILKCIEILKEDGKIGIHDGSYLVYPSKEILRVVLDEEIVTLSGTESHQRELLRMFCKLNALLRSFVDLIFFDDHTIGNLNSGPYEIDYRGKRCDLVVRDFFQINPQCLWDSLTDNLYTRIRTYAIYRNVRFKFNPFGDFYANSSLSERSVALRVEAETSNGMKSINTYDSLKRLFSSIERSLVTIDQKVRSMSRKQLLEKYVEISYYSLKPLRDILEKDWSPSREAYQRVRSETLLPKAIELLEAIEQTKPVSKSKRKLLSLLRQSILT